MKPTISDDLIRSRDDLLYRDSNPHLLAALRSICPDLSDNVFVVHWIPEQGENIYTVLVDGTKVVEVEISRMEGVKNPVSVEVITLQEYFRRYPRLSKVLRRKLDAAIKLSKTGKEEV